MMRAMVVLPVPGLPKNTKWREGQLGTRKPCWARSF